MDNWYFEYEVQVMEDDELFLRCGVVSAANYAEAMSLLEYFYGKTIVKIERLYCVDFSVYEFNNDLAEFDLHVSKKESV